MTDSAGYLLPSSWHSCGQAEGTCACWTIALSEKQQVPSRHFVVTRAFHLHSSLAGATCSARCPLWQTMDVSCLHGLGKLLRTCLITPERTHWRRKAMRSNDRKVTATHFVVPPSLVFFAGHWRHLDPTVFSGAPAVQPRRATEPVAALRQVTRHDCHLVSSAATVSIRHVIRRTELACGTGRRQQAARAGHRYFRWPGAPGY